MRLLRALVSNVPRLWLEATEVIIGRRRNSRHASKPSLQNHERSVPDLPLRIHELDETWVNHKSRWACFIASGLKSFQALPAVRNAGARAFTHPKTLQTVRCEGGRHIVPSPACGGGTGRGPTLAPTFVLPPPHPSPASGRGSTPLHSHSLLL